MVDKRRESPMDATDTTLPSGPGSTSLGGPGNEADIGSSPVGGSNPDVPQGTSEQGGQPEDYPGGGETRIQGGMAGETDRTDEASDQAA